ncbi:serine protease/ABC transporter B family protein tagC [Colletotrichum tofieldiae]|nr:serine protease/ABC transporter B family protein tagC [Colletotrichum tofieldiae]
MPLLNGNAFTLGSLEPEGSQFNSLNLSQAEEKPKRVLIETKVKLNLDQKKWLHHEAHLELEKNLGANTWLCKLNDATAVIDLSLLRGQDFVKDARDVPRDLKIQPELKNRETEEAIHTVDIVLYEKQSSDSISQLSEDIARRGSVDIVTMAFRRENSIIRLELPQSKLSEVAMDPRVSAIEKVHELALHNNVAREVMHADVLVNNTRFRGKGRSSLGFDKGSMVDTHPAFAGRVKSLIAVGRQKSGQTDDRVGHGTHVCGSALGNGSSKAMGGDIQGTAPEAELIIQALADENNRVFGRLTRAHQLVGPNWDTLTEQVPYNNASTDIDNFVWANPDMVVCFSAGNDGRERTKRGHIGGQAAAKNCITVGSCDNQRPAKDGDCMHFDATGVAQGNPSNVSGFSSRGPTWENRMKPDVVAPGSMILSAKTRAASITVKENFGVSTDPLWYFNTGTSMATPLVAGCAAVLRQALIESKASASPSAALIKAMLINGARDMGRRREEQGFGRVDLSNSVIVKGETKNRDFIEGQLTEEVGEDEVDHQFTLSKYMGDTAAKGMLKITLVWTDVADAVLQHEVILRVTVNYDNKIETKSGTLNGPDGGSVVNAVGQVLWENLPRDAIVTVIVRLDSVLLDVTKSQRFALVWSVSEQNQ